MNHDPRRTTRPKAVLASTALLAILVVSTSAPGMPALASAVSGWSLTANPTTIPEGVPRDVAMRLTDTDGSGDIGCTRIVTPAAVTILGAVVTGTSAQSPWTASIGPGSLVRVSNPDGNGKLKQGDWVDFRVTVRGEVAGQSTWTGSALQNNDCTGTPFLANIQIQVTTTPMPSPSPSASAEPSPSPPLPTPTAAPTPAAPPPPAAPEPSGSAAAIPFGSPPPTPTPSPPTDRASPDLVPSGSSQSPSDALSSQDGPGARLAARSDAESGAFGLGIQALALLDGPLMWFIPGAILAGPGLMILLWLAMQTVTALAWVPAVRRMSGDPVPIRRRRRPGD